MKTKSLCSALLSVSLSSGVFANEVFDVNFANSCRSFGNFEERQKWWTTQFGFEVVSAALLPTDAVGPEIRYGQLTLMKRLLQKNNALDYQKLLVLELEASSILAELYGDEVPLYEQLENSAATALGAAETELNILRICAFECPIVQSNEISNEFKECIK